MLFVNTYVKLKVVPILSMYYWYMSKVKLKQKAPRRVSTLQTYYFCPFRCITCWFYKNRKYFIFISNKCSMTCIMSWIQNKSLFLEFRDSKMNSNFSLQETIWNFDVCHLANINWPSLQGDNNFFLFKMNLRKQYLIMNKFR